MNLTFDFFNALAVFSLQKMSYGYKQMTVRKCILDMVAVLFHQVSKFYSLTVRAVCGTALLSCNTTLLQALSIRRQVLLVVDEFSCKTLRVCSISHTVDLLGCDKFLTFIDKTFTIHCTYVFKL